MATTGRRTPSRHADHPVQRHDGRGQARAGRRDARHGLEPAPGRPAGAGRFRGTGAGLLPLLQPPPRRRARRCATEAPTIGPASESADRGLSSRDRTATCAVLDFADLTDDANNRLTRTGRKRKMIHKQRHNRRGNQWRSITGFWTRLRRGPQRARKSPDRRPGRRPRQPARVHAPRLGARPVAAVPGQRRGSRRLFGACRAWRAPRRRAAPSASRQIVPAAAIDPVKIADGGGITVLSAGRRDAGPLRRAT